MPVTEDVRTDVDATPARLRDRSWGVRIRSAEDLTGHVVMVRRRNGDEFPRRLVNRVATYRDDQHPALYVAEDIEGPVDAFEDDELAVPQRTTAAGRALLAGRLIATVTLPDGQEIPVEVRVRRRGSGGAWVNGTLEDPGAVVSIYALGERERVGRVVEGFRVQWFDAAVDVRVAVRTLFSAAGNAANQPLLEERGYRFAFEGDAAGRDPTSTERPSLSSLAATFRVEDEADEVRVEEEANLRQEDQKARVRETIVEALALWAVSSEGTIERRAERIVEAEDWLNVHLPH